MVPLVSRISEEQERIRSRWISFYFLEKHLNQSKTSLLQSSPFSVEEIKAMDPFLTDCEKSNLEIFIKNQKKKTVVSLRRTFRTVYDLSADTLSKEELLRRMYILERNDIVRSQNFELRSSLISPALLEPSAEESSEMNRRYETFQNYEDHLLCRAYRNLLERSPRWEDRPGDREAVREEIVEEIMDFTQEEMKAFHTRQIMGIYQDPKPMLAEWGKSASPPSSL